MARSKKIQGNIEVVNLVANDPTLIEQTPSDKRATGDDNM